MNLKLLDSEEPNLDYSIDDIDEENFSTGHTGTDYTDYDEELTDYSIEGSPKDEPPVKNKTKQNKKTKKQNKNKTKQKETSEPNATTREYLPCCFGPT